MQATEPSMTSDTYLNIYLLNRQETVGKAFIHSPVWEKIECTEARKNLGEIQEIQRILKYVSVLALSAITLAEFG